MDITSIQSKVMLCSVTISTWVARRFDGKVTQEVESKHHAKGIGRFNKRLLPEHAPSFAEVVTLAGRIRSYFYDHTLKYDQLGVRLLPTMIDELVRQERRGLTVIANDTARPDVGIGRLISARLVKRLITSHIGTNPETQQQMLAHQIDVELVPQGTLAERIRAGGHGLGGVLTPTGVGTVVQDGKQTLELDGRVFLVERPLRADFALVNAWRADHIGNLTYAMTARNFNPLMALAADIVIAESKEIVPTGVIAPDDVMTPAVIVDRLIGKERNNG